MKGDYKRTKASAEQELRSVEWEGVLLQQEIKRLSDRNQRIENAITEVSELVGQSCGVWFPSTDGGCFEKWDSLFSRFMPKFAELFDEAKKGGE